ncbi:SPFH domain / Band 7 family protein [Parafrankia irregularis]|uniref:SPFH domain / Band 7 family protein n=1 Tax=Parafrankia irregularis TaxID=795642 RepID=A0A0S4QKU9_9ACTN|nr:MULTISPECIES: SPFH domain-containing protein [Parafrankia]MBE3202361.1 SPFH domain-containing protein [Parafrankia sp. CH37]CUU56115.1 SPFH domain / Band 7 family protein [Parafrankia irregularis]
MRFRSWRSRAGIAVLALLGIYLLVLGFSTLGSFDRTNGGEVAVVRNGGPLDNHRIRQVIAPASGRVWVGLYSDVHKYPAQQRFYTITANEGQGDRPDHEVVRVPSKDGVEMGIEGTLYFSLNTDPDVLRTFDDKFGTRKFRLLSDGKQYAPYDGDNGWSAFLDTIIRPVIDNDLREQINTFDCAQLVSSCALVQLGANQAVNPDSVTGNTPTGPVESSNGNIAAVQKAINESLARDLESTLGEAFLVDLKFNLVRITLPAQVQEAVNKAQAAFAGVSEAQARVAQARADAEANKIHQSGYAACPACAAIDELKAIPPNVTTFAPGAGFAITSP